MSVGLAGIVRPLILTCDCHCGWELCAALSMSAGKMLARVGRCDEKPHGGVEVYINKMSTVDS